jgi:hypothetical protein
MQAPIFKTREEARAILTTKIENQRRAAADPRSFATTPPAYLIRDAEWRLRWIDCAPEGANHQCAPLQDKNGVPCGGNYDENVGPGQALREARVRHGRNPFSGQAELTMRERYRAGQDPPVSRLEP